MAKRAVADLLTGFLALVVVLVGFITRVVPEDLRIEAIVAAALFFVAGYVRKSPLLVNLGSTVPLCVMAFTGVAFTSRLHLSVFVVTSLFAAIMGAYARSKRRPAGVAIAISWAAIVVAVALLLIPILLESFSTKRVRYPTPRFAFTTADGRRVTNESIAGRVTVLAFWATWCGPCREELPRLEPLRARFSILAVNDERNGEIASAAQKAQAFFAKRKLSLPLVISDEATSKSFGVTALPALVVIDGSGDIRVIHTGYDGAENMERLLRF